MKSDVLVIGGGPAGVSCGIWLHQLGVSVTLLEASDRLGGLQTRSPYENLWIPGVQDKIGLEVAASLESHIYRLGVDVRANCPVLGVRKDDEGFHVVTLQGDLVAPYIVVATGTRPRAGHFKPATNVAIGPGTPMEALHVQNKRVAILGGGDNAFDQARFVRDRGGEVTIFSRTAPRAQKRLQDLVNDVPVVIGDFRANQNQMRINDAVFDAIAVMYGFQAVIPDGLPLRRKAHYILVNQFGETSLGGAFACGEVTNYWHPCVTTACAHGIQVAKRLSQRLSKDAL